MSQDSTNTPTPRDALAALIDIALPEDIEGLDLDEVEAVADAILAAGWRPPVDATETEWAFRYYDGHTSYPMSEERARRCASNDSSAVVLRRSVGPWEEQS